MLFAIASVKVTLINRFSFAPRYKPLPLCTTFYPSPNVANWIKLAFVDNPLLGFPLFFDVPKLLPISNAFTGLLANVFPKANAALPTFLKKIFRPPASQTS